MKQLFTILLLSVSLLPAFADDETYVPMIREDRVWEYSGYSKVYDGCVFHYMKFDGSETVNGMEYHRFVHFKTLIVNSDGEVAYRDYSTGPVYYLREEPGKVFVLCESDIVVREEISQLAGRVEDPKYSEFMAYDFEQLEGTEWGYPCMAAIDLISATIPAVVRWESPINIEGESCRVQRFEGIANEKKVKFIEGIGTTFNGCLPAPNFDDMTGLADNTYSASLQSCLNRVLDGKGNVVYQCEYANIPPENDGFAPIIEDGKVWEYCGTYFKQQDSGLVVHYMKFDGTVEVNDHVYHGFGVYNSKFYRSTWTEDGKHYELVNDEMRDGPMWFLREDGGRVYGLTWIDMNCLVEIKSSETSAIPSEDHTYGEIKLYDFTLPENGTMEFVEYGQFFPLGNKITVYYQDNIIIEGTSRLVQQFWTEDYVENAKPMYAPPSLDEDIFYIEGIGVSSYGCIPYNSPMKYTGMRYDNSYCPYKESSLKSVRNAEGILIYGAKIVRLFNITICKCSNSHV